MKTLVFVTLAVALILLAPAEEDFRQILSNPKPFLEKLENEIRATDRSPAADKALAIDLQNLAYAINQEIIAAESPSWLNPSPERGAVISKWAELLAPHTQNLVELAFGDGFATSEAAKQSRSVLDFAPATPAFAEQVRPFLNGSPWVAFAAADLLYEHRLLQDADKQIVRGLKPSEESAGELERWARGVSSFDMTDGLEIAKRCLASSPRGESPESIVEQYRNGLAIVTALGEQAISLLPELESLIANPAIKTAGCLGQFEYARDVVSGKQPRPLRAAKNGSGPLTDTTGMQGGKPRKAAVNASPPKGIPKTANIGKTDQPPNSSIPWSIIFVLIVAATGLLWLLAKRCSWFLKTE